MRRGRMKVGEGKGERGEGRGERREERGERREERGESNEERVEGENIPSFCSNTSVRLALVGLRDWLR